MFGLTTDDPTQLDEYEKELEGSVLQSSDESQGEQPTTQSYKEFIELEDESVTATSTDNKQVELGDNAIREVVVNTAALNILGLTESEAIDKTINLSFIIVGELL